MSRDKQRQVVRKGLFGSIYSMILLLLCYTVSAQDLCNNPAGTEPGDFTLLTPAVGCSPFNVKIQDISGGTEIEYYYYYTGESESQLGTLTSTTALEETYFSASKPTVFTILQKGKKNGKDMYACKNITVRPNNQPLFTYNSCNNRILNLIIPDTVVNDFDSYRVDWGDGSSETISSLPFEGRKAYAVPSATKLVKVEGVYTTTVGCTAPPFQTVAMNEGGNYANIDKIELNSNRQIVEGSFDGLDIPYRLFKRGVLENYDMAVAEQEVKRGHFELSLSDTDQVCFSVFRNSGGCFESAGEVCTVPLDDIDVSGMVNVISWKSHPVNIVNTLFDSNGKIESVLYNIIRTNSESGVVDMISNVSSPYSDIVDCKIPYCYKIEAVVTGYPKFGSSIQYTSKSISNEVCVDRKDFNPPAITNAYASVNAPNSVEVAYVDNSGWNLNKNQFRLLRLDGTDFVAIDSSASNLGFTDITASINDSSYCYKINYTDECGSTSQPSPEFCTVYISSANQQDIDWTTESPFADEEPIAYQVIYFEETSGTPVEKTSYPFPTASHELNLDSFEEIARCQIKAVDVNGVESLSNIIEIPIHATIFLPNTFTPNGDGLNEVLVITGDTKRLVDYQFVIYNRWGETVFSSDDPTATWSGRIGNDIAASGYYTYKIDALTNTGEPIQKKGVVLLMR